MTIYDSLIAKAIGGSGGGGGGGSSDFSTATVTITNNKSSGMVTLYIPHAFELYNDAEAVVVIQRDEPVTVNAILYKGSAYAQMDEVLNSSVSGDVSKEEGGYVITGNGTITFTD